MARDMALPYDESLARGVELTMTARERIRANFAALDGRRKLYISDVSSRAGQGDPDEDQAAFLEASADGRPVVVNAGRLPYQLDNLPITPGLTLLGDAPRAYRPGYVQPLIKRKAGATRVFAPQDVVLNAWLHGLSVDGLDNGPDGLGAGGHHIDVTYCTWHNLNNAMGEDNSYIHTRTLIGNTFYNNNRHVRNAIDGIINENVLTASLLDALSFGTGANGSMVLGNRIEWNGQGGAGWGVKIFEAENMTIGPNWWDANTVGGLHINAGVNISVTGGQWRRNGRLGDATTAHIEINGASDGIAVTGITTRSGGEDNGGAPPITPYDAIKITGNLNGNLTLVGNDLRGYSGGLAIRRGTVLGQYVQKHNIGVAGEISGCALNEYEGRLFQSRVAPVLVANGNTVSVAFSQQPVATYQQKIRALRVVARSATGQYYSARFDAYLVREATPAQMKFGNVGGEIGTAGTFKIGAAATMRLDVSAIDADGANFTMTVANTIGQDMTFQAELL